MAIMEIAVVVVELVVVTKPPVHQIPQLLQLNKNHWRLMLKIWSEVMLIQQHFFIRQIVKWLIQILFKIVSAGVVVVLPQVKNTKTKQNSILSIFLLFLVSIIWFCFVPNLWVPLTFVAYYFYIDSFSFFFSINWLIN